MKTGVVAPEKNEGLRCAAVRAGSDCTTGDAGMIWGLIPFAGKISTATTGGAMFLFEHRDMLPGGPPRHIHFGQDEWFYVVKGEYAFEIGDERFELKAGDSLLAPRNIPHAWANVGTEAGTLITAVMPAGTFEDFIRETTTHATLPSPEEIARAFERHNMKVVGPPLAVKRA